ncbi:MAG: hypothetical protein EAX96_20570 [Candidatus Lokiarchaeota archaeon]|nr:hypothetical protein [Candidatus Lokiarchaeota archaeon]
MKKRAYPAKYIDDLGEVSVQVWNDGKCLELKIRDVIFSGSDFDSLEPKGDPSPELLSKFTLYLGKDLCNCNILCDIPIDLILGSEKISSTLSMKLILGKPIPPRGIDKEVLILELKYLDKKIVSSGESGWFEDELIDIQRKLPADAYILCCFNCLFSDYSPYGHGLFGSMMCFRDNKENYLAVKSKNDFFAIEDTMTDYVQEIHICPEFQKRIPGTGYRG